jgi:hypothetical protein
VLVDERDRLPIAGVAILSHDGRQLGPYDLNLVDRACVGVQPISATIHAPVSRVRNTSADFAQASPAGSTHT